MVRPGAVVLHPAAELGEHNHDQIIAGVMLFQVVEEVADGVGHIGPQLLMHGRLVEVGVERTVGGVEDLGTQVRQVYPRHVSQVLGDGSFRVFDGGRVFFRSDLEDVGAFQGVTSGLAQVVHGRAGADGGSVHAGEPLQDLRAVLFRADPRHSGQHAVVLQVGDGSYGHTAQRQRPGQALAEVNCF